jgi:hypothetical protein
MHVPVRFPSEYMAKVSNSTITSSVAATPSIHHDTTAHPAFSEFSAIAHRVPL